MVAEPPVEDSTLDRLRFKRGDHKIGGLVAVQAGYARRSLDHGEHSCERRLLCAHGQPGVAVETNLADKCCVLDQLRETTLVERLVRADQTWVAADTPDGLFVTPCQCGRGFIKRTGRREHNSSKPTELGGRDSHVHVGVKIKGRLGSHSWSPASSVMPL